MQRHRGWEKPTERITQLGDAHASGQAEKHGFAGGQGNPQGFKYGVVGWSESRVVGPEGSLVSSLLSPEGHESQPVGYKTTWVLWPKFQLIHVGSGLSRLMSVSFQSSPDQGETKSAQANPPAKMLPPKQPMYAMPGLASFLTPSDLQAFRSGTSPASLARTLGSKSLLPSLSASPPPPPSFPLSTPLHQQLPLPPHAQGTLLSPPVSMSPAPQPPVLPAPMALQVQLAMSPSPPGPQVSRTQ